MICPQCRHENPAGNRFCGSCGTKLPVAEVRVEPKAPSVNWLKSMEENKPTARELEMRRIEAEHAAREREIAERAERAARREREIAERAARAKAATAAQSQAQQQRPVDRGSSAGAPSFLGLSGDYEQERPSESTEDYERSDLYGGGGRSYTRALLLLVLLLVVAGLGFLQWRYSSGLRASPPAEKPSAAQPEQAGADEKQASPENPEAKAEDEIAQKEQSNPASPSAQNKADSKNKSVNQEAAGKEETSNEPEEPRTGKMNPPVEPEEQAATPAEAKKGSAASGPEKTSEPTEAKSKPPARVRAKTQPVPEVSDEPVRLAESYIYGRGLPQSCPQAVTILREASNRGNYKAQIKLGALYATGNCVSLDRVQAYRFLTRALQSKPGNTWVEQNRSMLWAQMNEQERRQAMEQNF